MIVVVKKCEHLELLLIGIIGGGRGKEVICSVDFSKNYENKQKHEIQSAYFGDEAFTVFTAACYYRASSSFCSDSF